MMSLAAGAALSYIRYDVEQMRIPADDTWTNKRINGQDALSLDIEANQRLLYDFIYAKDEEKPSQEESE